LPQYGVGHWDLVKVLEATDQRQNGLFLTGSYFARPAVAVCLSVARKTAMAVRGHLENAGGFQLRQTVQ